MQNKTLVLPQTQTVILRLDLKTLRRDHSLRIFHLREESGALAVAEGESKQYDMTEGASGIYSVRRHLFYFNAATQIFHGVTENYRYRNVLSEPMKMTYAVTKEGKERRFCVTPSNIYWMSGGTTFTNGVGRGGSCACIHAERMFTANGYRLNYTAPLNFEDWLDKRRLSGYFEFPTDGGEILAMQSYKEKLYLFRRRGITQVRLLGEELNAKSTVLPYGWGDLVPDSVAPCGDKICFFTERGFYSFNGGVASAVADGCVGEIDLTERVKAVSAYGKYYALVTVKSGKKSLFCFEPETQSGHFILNGAEDVTAGDDFWFKRGLGIYRLTQRGLPAVGECRLEADNLAFHLGDERFVDAVAVEGEGEFEVCLRSSRGERRASGAAQTVLKFRSPLRGNGYSVTVKPKNAEARLVALCLRVREENNGN